MSKSQEITSELGRKVRDIRMQKKLTRESFAEMLDVSSRFLADVEAGKVGISLTTLKKICITLGTSADNLLGIKRIETSDQQEIAIRVSQIPPKYLPQLAQIITAFSETVQVKES